MNIEVVTLPSKIFIITGILSLVVLGIGIYLLFLLIKTLRIYIKKNS